MSLRLRLTLFYSAFFAIVLSAVAVSVYLLTERSLTASLEERADQALNDIREDVDTGIAQLPGGAYYEILLYGRAGTTPESPAALRNSAPLQRVRDNPTDDSIATVVGESALQELIQTGLVATTATLPNGQRLYVIGRLSSLTVRVTRTDALSQFEDLPPRFELGSAVFVGIPSSGTVETLGQLGSDLALTVVLAFVFFALGVFVLSRQVLAPVQRVTQAAARVTGRDLSQRVPVPRSNDEMRELAVTINHMLERLQESFETQRRFTADASHELRTPVTAIVGHANYLLRRTEPSSAQVDSLTVIRREAERMAKLVNDLLELARADAGFSISKEPMNLVDVVEAVHMEISPVAGDVNVEVDVPHPVMEVEGDPSRLKQVVLNLVQNAINAGAHEIRVSLYKEKGDVVLQVLDDGPGIPAEAIEHLFDRFYRVDGARSTRGNGSGLGLAIVRWIVNQHGGKVDVESKLGEGSVFSVRLPELDSGSTEGDFVKRTLTDTLTRFRAVKE